LSDNNIEVMAPIMKTSAKAFELFGKKRIEA
jgi:hypothetical protein